MRFQLLALVFGAASVLAAPVVLPKAVNDAANANVERQFTGKGWRREDDMYIPTGYKRQPSEGFEIDTFQSGSFKRVEESDSFTSPWYKLVKKSIAPLFGTGQTNSERGVVERTDLPTGW
jgi:hypothetical protein